MASTVPTDSSTEETTNFARLCRLLVDVGTQVLRETFNNIHSPTNLQSTLATNRSTLQSLRTRKILNPNQWGKLFPAKPASVSSRDFDITLLMVLFRNICGLTAPATGWGALPAATDVSLEADVARVNYFRNTVFAHAEQASVDNATFSSHWNSIRDTLVRLGGVKHRAAIDHLETECMDPETEEHCIELLSQWKKDEDNVKDKLEELGSGLGKVIKKLDDLEAASIALKKEITVDEGKRLKPKEMTHGPGTCKEEYHEREPMDYYCTDCRVCICLKCGQTRHNHHNKMDIQKVAKEKKTQMAKLFERVQAKAVKVEEKMKEQTKFMKKSEDEIYSAEKRLTETVEQKIRLLNEHKTAVKKELSEICKAQQTEHASKMESFEVFLNELRESAEFGEDVVKQSTALEIVQGECASVLDRCEELLNAEEMEIYQPMYVTYRVNKETAGFVPGEVVAFHKLIDPLQSTAEGEGLKEAQVAAESHFTVTIRDSEGNRCPITKAKVSVKIYSPTEEDVQTKIEECKDGMYKVSYKPKSVGVHDVAIETNGTPLTGSPWRVQVIPHRYKSIAPFTSFDEKQGQFRYPQSIAVSETTGNIAIGDLVSLGVQLFDSKWKYLRTITDRGTMGHASSVAFTASGDVIVIHGNKMIVSTEHGSFIKTSLST